MQISILGCGWLGTPLAVTLLQEGFYIKGSTTSKSKLKTLKGLGIEPFLIDLASDKEIPLEFLKTDVLIIDIPHKVEKDFEKLIAQVEKSRVGQIIFISSTSVYPSLNSIVDENTTTIRTPLRIVEELFEKNQHFQTTILRFGGLFGYDRQPGRFFRKRGFVPNPEGFVNLIHRDDCIAILKEIIDKNIQGEVLNACASDHPTRGAFYSKEIQKQGLSDIALGESDPISYKIVSNQKLKQLLSYQFKYDNLMNY